MNSRAVTGAVLRFGRAAISPNIPRFKAGFKTLYLHCRPAARAANAAAPRASVPRRSPFVRRWLDNAAFHVARVIGRITSLRIRRRPTILVALDAMAPTALLHEPALRSLAEHHPDHAIHLWADKSACDLYRCAPYLDQIRPLNLRAKRAKTTAATSALSLAHFGYHLGRTRCDRVICSLAKDPRLEKRFIDNARTSEIWLLQRDAHLAQNETHPTGRLIRHLPTFLTAAGDELASLAAFARHWNADIDGEFPRIHAGDTAAQLAYTLARAWRGDAADLGATSLVGIAPSTSARATPIRLATWSDAIRELWLRHQVLSILIATLEDPDAVEQLSHLLGEIPHEKLAADIDPLELAALIAKIDSVISTDNLAAQLALVQGIPTLILADPHRRRLYTWAEQRNMTILETNSPPATNPTALVAAFCTLTNRTTPRRTATPYAA